MLTRHIRESLQVTPGPFPDFWVGPGDEAMRARRICSRSPEVGGGVTKARDPAPNFRRATEDWSSPID